MANLFLITMLSLLLVVTDIHAQKHLFDSVEPSTIIKEIKNELGQPYNLIITLPADYQTDKEYKILYYLDAWWLKDLVMGCYRIKSLSAKTIANNMEDVILVGVSSVGDEKAWNRQRNMDFTPSKYNLNIKINFGEVPLDESTTGGADAFLRFFKNEIIQSVESEFPVDKTTRGLLGHSFGGLLGFYSYLEHSDLFTNYLLISPAVWWNQSEIFQDRTSFVNKRESNLFIAVGTSEANMLQLPLADLIGKLKSAKNENLNFNYKQYEHADHHSVLPQAIYDGIGFLYTKSK